MRQVQHAARISRPSVCHLVSTRKFSSIALQQSCALRPASSPPRRPSTLYPAAPTLARFSNYSSNKNTRVRDGTIPHAVAAEEPTIYALSTAPGRAAIAIIRISGPACLSIYRALCPSQPLPCPRRATLRTLHQPHETPSASTILDSGAIVLYFPAPNTVTGDEVLELHIHGGPATTKAILRAISLCNGGSDRGSSASRASHTASPSSPTPRSAPYHPPPRSAESTSGSASPPSPIRYAEPGEFTRRAFERGRLSLPQVEALGHVLDASTERQRQLSVLGSSNRLAARYEDWRAQLQHARGELEALIDFAEDQQFSETPQQLVAGVTRRVRTLRVQIKAQRENAVRGELLRRGIGVALLGAPNAGKSSLLNCIVGRDAAIVSPEAGTTRDVMELGVDLDGWFVRFMDCAGLRGGEGVGLVEQEGMRRARDRAAQADVVVVLLSVAPGEDTEAQREVLKLAKSLDDGKKNVVVVLNKADTLPTPDAVWKTGLANKLQTALPDLSTERIFAVSCKEAAEESVEKADSGGIQTFLKGLTQKFHELTSPLALDGGGSEGTLADPSVSEESLGATERQRLLLDECLGCLEAFLEEVERGAVSADEDEDTDNDETELDVVVAAEWLREGADCLAKITGRGLAGDVEEVLGVVFEKFCVGK